MTSKILRNLLRSQTDSVIPMGVAFCLSSSIVYTQTQKTQSLSSVRCQVTPSMSIPALVDGNWLKENLKRVTTLDASYHMASTGRNAEDEFIAARIPGARRFDIDRISDLSSQFPHMLPNADEFTKSARELGVRASKPVVVYSRNSNYFGASRAWWMFRVFGKNDVGILHGGWDHWQGPVESGVLKSDPEFESEDVFLASFNASLVRTTDQMVKHSREGDAIIIDARSEERFSGIGSEPRPGQKHGHIPGSISLPYQELLRNGFFRAPSVLRKIFEKRGIPLNSNRQMAITCGSGVSACNVAVAMHIVGSLHPASVYDGSWTAYSKTENPVATGVSP